MMKGQFLSDIVDNKELQHGKLNLITSPCGSGKSQWARSLKDTGLFDTLYLIDSRRGKESLKRRFGVLRENNFDGHSEYFVDGMKIMTYAGFAYAVTKFPEKFKFSDYTTIIADELDSCLRYREIDGDILHTIAVQELRKRIVNETNLVVATTATPSRVKTEFRKELFDVPLHGTPRSYETKNVIKYSNIHNVLSQITDGRRGIVYVPHIRQIQELEALFEKAGIKAMGIWSKNAKDKPMDGAHMALSDYIAEYEAIPDDIQVLIINQSSMTCINIYTAVDFVCINDCGADVQTQIRGRIRSDVDTMYILSRKATVNITSEQIEPWLGRKLSRLDRQDIVEAIGATNDHNRKIGWTTIAEELSAMGYDVTKKIVNGYHYFVIN